MKVKVRFLNLLVEISFFPSCALLVYRVSYYKAILYTNVDRREDRSFLNLFLPFFLSCVLLVFRVFYYNVILYINVVRRCGIEVSFLKLSVKYTFFFSCILLIYKVSY